MAKRAGWQEGLDQDQINFYLGLEPEQAVCRGGRRHDFNMSHLIPGREFPGGIELARQRGGVYQLTDHCRRGCGRWIRYETLPGGAIDWDSARYGGGGLRYHAKGLGLTAADDKIYMRYLQAEMIMEQIKLARKRAPAAKQAANGQGKAPA